MENKTKRIFVALLAVIVIQLAVSSLSHAASEKELWKQHEKGIYLLLQCFQGGKSAECYQYGLRSIVSSELALINKGVSPKHPYLVARLLSDLKTADDLPSFGWKVIKQRVERRVGSPLSLWGSFENEEFIVMLHDYEILGGEAKVRINNYERRN